MQYKEDVDMVNIENCGTVALLENAIDGMTYSLNNDKPLNVVEQVIGRKDNQNNKTGDDGRGME